MYQGRSTLKIAAHEWPPWEETDTLGTIPGRQNSMDKGRRLSAGIREGQQQGLCSQGEAGPLGGDKDLGTA